ncbi:RluA family pseudouridine synthase [Psychrobacter sp. YP14]|uniref:RluA family pseudouridine synthase n=1 Tax=Psychrobacter sp. YP14 TaxID=2203895 RepID=UPI000D7E5D24|nr:RluA family pseudouridine synthase [Psychrobacter sp. YP14]
MSKSNRKPEKNVDKMNSQNSKIEQDLEGLMASVGAEPTQVRRHSTKARPQSADEDIKDFGQVNHLEVTRNQHGQRIDNFLLARLKGMPRAHIYKMIRSDEVRINNKRCKPYNNLERGDVVRIAPVKLATREKPVISEGFAKSLLERVVYEDEGLIVLNKPSGMAVHGGSGLDFGVIEAMRDATSKKYLELVHRIDKDTSGLLMIAKKRSTLKVLQEYLREKTIQKYYLCLVKGQPALNEFEIDAPLLRYTVANGERRVKVDKANPEAKLSQTTCKVLARFKMNGEPVSLIEAMPHTGRTHQIRVHLAYLGHPILGDDKYNIKDTSGVRRLCLHAWQLDVPEYEVIKAPLPEDMQSLLPADFKLD